MFSESDFSETFVFLRERKEYVFVWWEKRRKERTRYELLYLFILFCMFGNKNKMETLLLMLSTSRKTKTKKQVVVRNWFLIKEKYFQEMNEKAECEVGFYFPAF